MSMENYQRLIIDTLKKTMSDYVSTGNVDIKMLNEAQKRLVFEIDRCKVSNLPCNEIEALYGDVKWLKCDLLGL